MNRGFLLVSAIAWAALTLGGGAFLALPVLCTGRLLGALPSSGEFAYLLGTLSPLHLAASWGAMLLAMMLPMTAGPVRHVRARSFRQARFWATIGFLAGYLSIWILAALPLIGITIVTNVLVSSPMLPVICTLALSIAWQMAPLRQRALNKCHGRPTLTGFGTTPLGSSLGYGLDHGLWCLLTCAPVMLVALTAPSHNTLWMACAALWIWADRLEAPKRPVVRLYVPLRAWRAGQFRLMQALDSAGLR